jgi:hypothetical protein
MIDEWHVDVFFEIEIWLFFNYRVGVKIAECELAFHLLDELMDVE